MRSLITFLSSSMMELFLASIEVLYFRSFLYCFCLLLCCCNKNFYTCAKLTLVEQLSLNSREFKTKGKRKNMKQAEMQERIG